MNVAESLLFVSLFWFFMARVLVAAPICAWYAYCWKEFSQALLSLTYPNKDLFFCDNSEGMDFYTLVKGQGFSVLKTEHLLRIRDMVTRDHNIIRQKALDEGYDYLLLCDCDVLPPPDALERLLSHGKDVVSALFFGHHDIGGENRVVPFAWVFSKEKRDWNHTGYLLDTETWSGDLFEIAFAGMGCVLLSRRVLEQVPFRYSREMDAWDDRWLGVDVWSKGFSYWLDTSVRCRHLYKNRPFNYWELKQQGRN